MIMQREAHGAHHSPRRGSRNFSKGGVVEGICLHEVHNRIKQVSLVYVNGREYLVHIERGVR